jgi:DNA-binding IclR family transcriptional regulator
LQQLELLDRDPATKRFQTGPMMVSLAFAVTNNLEIKENARPFMQDLSNRIGEVVGLMVRSGTQIILSEIIRTDQVLNINMNTGAIVPPHAAASCKAILAFIPEAEMEAIWNRAEITPFTENTITSMATYKKQLKEVRRLGYALAVEENTYGFSAIAAPVRDNHGEVIASVTVMVPSFRITKEKLVGSFRKEVSETADQIAYSMGYRD